MKHAVVIGAGLSGLAAAWALHSRGWGVTVLEKSGRAGGALRTVADSGYRFEWGANSFLLNDSRVLGMLRGTGLEERMITPGAAGKKRYLVRGGRAVAVPMSPLKAVTTPLLSFRAKVRVLGEPWRGRGGAGQTVAEFVRRRLGPEVLDFTVQPFVSGIYAGDPERLMLESAFPALAEMERAHGSLVRGMLKREKSPHRIARRLVSWPEGMGELPDALARGLGEGLFYEAEVVSVEDAGNGRRRISWRRAGAVAEVEADAVIAAVPAHALGRLPGFGGLTDAAGSIAHAPVAVVGLGFRREDVGHALDGFGILIPEREGLAVLGALFSSSLFPGRAPEGHVLLTCFLGGRLHPERAEGGERELVERAVDGLRGILNLRGAPVWWSVKQWSAAIPQYEAGHTAAITEMERFETAHPGLYVAGNFRGGISVPQCLLAANGLVERVVGSA